MRGTRRLAVGRAHLRTSLARVPTSLCHETPPPVDNRKSTGVDRPGPVLYTRVHICARAEKGADLLSYQKSKRALNFTGLVLSPFWSQGAVNDDIANVSEGFSQPCRNRRGIEQVTPKEGTEADRADGVQPRSWLASQGNIYAPKLRWEPLNWSFEGTLGLASAPTVSSRGATADLADRVAHPRAGGVFGKPGGLQKCCDEQDGD